MDLENDLGTGEAENVVGTLQIARMTGEAVAAVAGLVQTVALDHGPHRAVENENPPGELLGQCLFTLVHRHSSISRPQHPSFPKKKPLHAGAREKNNFVPAL